MIEIIVGDYKPNDSEMVVKEFIPSIIFRNTFNTKPLVLFAEELQLSKNIINFIKENATLDCKIICIDTKMIRGMKNSKNCKIDKSGANEEFNPFEVAKFFLVEKDRRNVLDYLLSNKPSLWMPIKVLTCQYMEMCSQNKKIVAYLDMYLWKVNKEILYYLIAFKMIPEQFRFMKWLYPKKEKKDE